jgi:signal transduction histidine kinase
MIYNQINLLETCVSLVNEGVNTALIYYTHIPTALVSLLIGLIVFLKNKDTVSKMLLLMSISFSLWVVCSMITWTNFGYLNYMFFWSFFGLLSSLIFIFSLYFSYIFFEKTKPKLKFNLFILILLLPIFLLTSTSFNTSYFDNVWCVATENTNFMIYYYIVGIISFISILFLGIKNIFFSENKNKKMNILFLIGIEIFIIMFSFTSFGASYLYEAGFIDNYNLEPYGLFGMVIFMSFLAYMIVKFKAFNIKLLGAQALVWALIILVGSQFLYLADMPTTSIVLTSITLILSAGIGLLVVRSVKKVDEQRELLDIANKNQESLLHFITHQIKGFMTKTRGIYAGILEGDYGEINGKVQAIVQYGLESETKGVDTIQNILNASNLKSGKVVFDKKEFDLTVIVKGIVDEFRKKIIDKGLELEENISSKPILFIGDELRIHEVFKNLLDNSIHYTEHGKVSITLKDSGDKIRYSIKDTGIGLSAADKKNLFQEGGRGETSLIHNVESTGYGLYIAKKIIEEHKGNIWAESQGRNKGSEFIVELPRK